MPRGAYEWFGNAAHGNGALGRAFVAGRRVQTTGVSVAVRVTQVETAV